MVEAAIFDMDGVMIDTEMIQSKAFELVLNEYGVTPELNDNGTVHVSGMTTPETWEYLMVKHNFQAPIEELTRQKREAVVAELRKGVTALPGLYKLLDNLQENNVALAVATSAQRERADLVIDQLGIRDYFQAIVTGNDVERGKPAPDPYLKAAEKLGKVTSSCVVFEDAEAGVRSGRAADMTVVAVPGEFTRNADFTEADIIIDSLDEIDYDSLTELLAA